MKRPSTDTLLALGLILLLVAVTTVATYWQTRQAAEQPVLATFSNRPDGARALRLWLEEMGYAVTTDTAAVFQLPDEADLALILEPELPGITEQEWEALDSWVAAGGTLLLAGEGFGTAFAFTHYRFDVDYTVAEDDETLPAAPLLASPPLSAPTLAHLRPRATLSNEGLAGNALAAEGNAEAPARAQGEFIPLLDQAGEPLLITFTWGEGRVLLSTLTYPFSNVGLKEAGNADVILNLVSLAGPAGSTIWFDEWHHGQRATAAPEIAGPAEWLRKTPAGHSLLYAGLVLFLGLALAGWRFGRPVPLPEERRRRPPLEHITAVANLKRRAGHRQATLATYHRQLKRVLGHRYRLDASLPDDAFVNLLAQYRPDLDEDALLRLLTRLRAPNVGEAAMVKLAQEVDVWLGDRDGR